MSVTSDPTRQGSWAPDLVAELAGVVALPGDPAYSSAGQFNLAVTRAPGAVVHARSADDFTQAMRFAAERGLRVAVQRTGHAPTPLGPDVIMIDTSALNGVELDPATATARVEAGVLWDEVVAAAAEHGLAPVCGSSTTVGVAGFLSGGGIGPMCRTLGAGSDWVRRFDVVTGDGERREVTPHNHPDLFWALRGGKSAAGIIVSTDIELVPMTSFYGGCVFFSGNDVAVVLHAWREWATTLPVEATTSACLLRLPDVPGLPAELVGTPSLAIRLAVVGDPEGGERAAAELLATASPAMGRFTTMPVGDIASVHDDPREPMPIRERGCLLDEFGPEVVDEALAAFYGSSGSLILLEVRHLGGRLAEPPEHADAFDGRTEPWSVLGISIASPDSGSELDTVFDRLGHWTGGLAMPNYNAYSPGVDDAAQMRRAYRGSTLKRLAEVSTRYDPDQVPTSVASSAPPRTV